MSTSLGESVLSLTTDHSAFDKGLEDAHSRAKSVTGSIGGIFDTLGKVGLGVFGVTQLVGAVGSLASGMVSGNAEFERYETQFGVLLGSTKAAKDRLAELADFGAKTPFELPEVVKADKILQGFGLHSEEAAKKFGYSGKEIRTIAGDVAAGAGVSFEEMAGYIGKFSSGATGEVISRFQELGIMTREQMAGMGLEFSKSGELLSPLPKATEVVLNAMKQKYGGMMDAQSGTFEGMMSNLSDWISQTKRQLMAPIFEVLKDKLGSVLAFLGSDTMKNAISILATGLATGIGKVVDLFTQATDIVGAFVRKMNLVINGGESFDAVFGEWAGIFDAAWATLKPIIDLISNLVGYFADVEDAGLRFHQALAGLIGLEASNWIVAIVQAIKPLNDEVSPLAEFISDNLIPILAALAAMILYIEIPAILGSAAAWAAEAAAAVSAAAATALAMAPVILTVAAVGLAIGLLVAAWTQNWGDIQGKTQSVWAVLEPLFNVVRDWLGVQLAAAVRWLSDMWTGVLLPALNTVWSFIQDFVIPLLGMLANVYIAAVTTYVQGLALVWTDVLFPALQAVWQFINDYIFPIFSDLVNIYILAVQIAVAALAKVWNEVLLPALTAAWDFIKTYLGPVAQWLADTVMTGVKNVFSDIGAVWTTVLGPALNALWGLIKDNLGPAIQWFVDNPLKALNTAWNTLKDVINAIKDAMQWVLDHLNAVPGAPGGESPSPGYALGTNYFPGGMALVGELGPELVTLPRGSRIYSSRESAALGGVQPAVYNFNMVVNTSAPTPSVVEDFGILQSMMGVS